MQVWNTVVSFCSPIAKRCALFSLVALICALLGSVAQANFDKNSEFYEDVQKNVVNSVLNLAHGEYYDGVSGAVRHYMTDFYITGNGGLPIFVERALDTDPSGEHEFGNMRLLYPKLEVEGKMMHPGYTPFVIDDNGEIPAQETAINHVPNACQALRYEYDYGPENQGAVDGYYFGIKFDALKFYIGQGKYIRFYHKVGSDSRFPSNANLVSQNNWYIDCVSSTRLDVYAPNGVVYEVNTQTLTGYNTQLSVPVEDPIIRYYTMRATDPFGNTLTYGYTAPITPTAQINFWSQDNDDWDQNYDYPKLATVTASDGRELAITYSSGRVSRIDDNSSIQRTLQYYYRSRNALFDLERVVRNDGLEWHYAYEMITGVAEGSGSYINVAQVIDWFRTPEHLTIDYQHSSRFSCEFYDTISNYAGYTCGSGERVPVLTQRTLSGPSIPTGSTETFNYQKSGNSTITTVTTPAARHEFEFGRLNYWDSPASMPAQSGKLVRHTVTNLANSVTMRETNWSWNKLYDVVDLSYFNTNWGTWLIPETDISGGNSYRPRTYHFAARRVPSQITTAQESSQFQRARSNHDNYGYPRTLVESSTLASGGGSYTRTTDFTYHNDSAAWILGKLQNETVQGEGVIARDYYANGKLQYEDRYGTRTDYAYHANGELAEKSWTKDGVTKTHRYQDYYRGIPRLEIDALGHQMSRTVADYGAVLTETDFNGATTTYQYDTLYRLSLVQSPEPGYANTVTSWSADGRVQTTTRGDYRKIVTHDAMLRPTLTQERDNTRPAEEVFKSIQYDAAGRIRFESIPSNNASENAGYEFTYDPLDRVLTNTYTVDNRTIRHCYRPDCNSTAPYDRLGGVTFGVISEDERGYLSTRNFRAYGSPSQRSMVTILQETETSPHHHITTTIDRNLLDQITQVDQGGYTRRYIYNSRKLLERVEQPEIGDTIYGYDEAGNRTSRSVGAEPATTYGYDNNNRLESIDYPGSTPDVAYTYDNNGNTVTANVGGGDWTYTYNTENQLETETLTVDGRTFALNYGYDTLGHLNQITYPTNRAVTPVADALGRVRSIGGYVTNADYFPNGQIQSITYDNGQVLNVTQNARALPETLLTSRNGSTLVDLTYTYDDSGNILQIADPILGNKDLGYDGANRLIVAVGPWGNGDIGYDDVGNIRTKSIGAKSLTYHYNAATNLLESITGTDTYTFGYDAYGNVSSNSRHNFTYDHASNMVQSGSNAYQYDAHNRRIKVTRQGVDQYYVYSNAGKLMHRYKPSTEMTTDYIYLAGQLVARHDEAPDTVPPIVVPPDDITTETTALQTPVTLGTASATDDVDGPLTPTADQSGPFSIGTHSVTWSATDAAGNTGTATQTVTVQDTTAPVLTVPADVTITASAPATVDIGNASATDIFSVTITNNGPATYPIGTTVVTWTATDANGNSSTGTQNVTVNEPPPGNTINGTSGNDYLEGTAGDDTINGGDGDDWFAAKEGNDTLNGGDGNDWLEGGVGADTMSGGTGNDTYIVDDAGDQVIELAGEGNDEVRSYVSYVLPPEVESLNLKGSAPIDGTGNALNNTLLGNEAVNTLIGLAGNDWIYALGGNDTLDGGEGNDWLEGGLGADTMSGGVGNDTYIVDDSGDQVIEQADAGTDEVRSYVTYVLSADVENLNLKGSAPIDGTGNALNNTLMGNEVANTLIGLSGNDWLYAFEGNDTIEGGDGNDWLEGGPGVDTMTGGAGNDTYFVDDMGDQVIEQAGEGSDEVRSYISYVLPEDVDHLNLQDSSDIDGTGNALNNNLIGNTGTNNLSGLEGDDTLYGEAGNDTLDGGSGNDWLEGGSGNDSYSFSAGHGEDTLREASEAGSDDLIQYQGAVTRYDLWFHRYADNLIVSRLGSGDQITIRDWYMDSNQWVERFTASGSEILSSNIQSLVDAMAPHGPPVNGVVNLTAAEQQTINTAIDAAWQ